MTAMESSCRKFTQDAPLPQGLPGTLEELEERARRYFRQARAENTVKAYRHDLEDFAV